VPTCAWVLYLKGKDCFEDRVGDNINGDLNGPGGGGVDWIRLAHGRGQWRALVDVMRTYRL
jgi:hypothetical protein